MITNFNTGKIALAAAFGLGAALTAQAQVVNGDFGRGLAGWTVFGDVSMRTPAAAGNSELFLTTAGQDADEYDFAGQLIGPFNVSGTAAVETGVQGGLETRGGFAIGAFDPPGDFAIEGSLAQQTFNAIAGQTLSFAWQFGTRDTGADYAFVAIDGSVVRLAGTGDAKLAGSGDDLQRTGQSTFRSSAFASSGEHRVSFGVVDVGDSAVRSSLAVDQVQILAVPEPDGMALMLFGGAGLVALRLKKAKSVT